MLWAGHPEDILCYRYRVPIIRMKEISIYFGIYTLISVNQCVLGENIFLILG